MSVRNLDFLFRPRSLAVVGASDRPGSVGGVVMRNLLAGGFRGPILPVNPKRAAVAGVLAYPNIAALPSPPDLAIVCTPAVSVPGIVAELGARGTKAAIVLTAGLGREKTANGATVQQAMLDAARPHLLRILGPNCVGALVPGLGLNASFAQVPASPGGLAFVSQSGALCTIVLDWARARDVGFSHFISLGDSADVDFGDVIDYLASDPATKAILLYIESVSHARKFMSAARAAARNKPVIAVKAGRTAQAAQAARSHTGAMAGGDDVMSAALARAGIVRVDTAEELFEAASTLARYPAMQGERLAILTNGGGPGVLAVDALVAEGGKLATLAKPTMAALDAVLPATWSRANPVDIIGDAPAERYGAALLPLLADPDVDAVLAMHAPTAIVPSLQPAAAIVAAAAGAAKPVLTCWLGAAAVADARHAFETAGLPTYESVTGAVRAFNHMVEYHRTQHDLMQVPPAMPDDFQPDVAAARAVVAAVLAVGRTMLTEPEAKAVLAAYGLPTVRTEAVADLEAAMAAADRIGYPVALKILSPDISHKSDVGGVALDIGAAAELRHAGAAMLARVKAARPEARVEGFTVQTMARRPGAYELILGVAYDPIFGPVILFGEGGVAVEVIRDRAVALPPLNFTLAAAMVQRTRIARRLAGFRDRPPIAFDALYLALVRVAQIVVDLPEVRELDINPLYADAGGVLALDARIAVASAPPGVDHLAIKPYPQELEEAVRLRDGRALLLRPIRPEDRPAHEAFIRHVEPGDLRYRFFGAVREVETTQMARFTQIDYDREMAFIATATGIDGATETMGVARAMMDPDNRQGEFAVLVRSDLKRQGLGGMLMAKLIRYARARGTGELVGIIMRQNHAMLRLAEQLGFAVRKTVDAETVEVGLVLK